MRPDETAPQTDVSSFHVLFNILLPENFCLQFPFHVLYNILLSENFCLQFLTFYRHISISELHVCIASSKTCGKTVKCLEGGVE